MALLKKKIGKRIYYYYTETKRVNGKPRLVKQVYLGPADVIYKKLESAEAPEPLEVEKRSAGAVTALWDQAQRLGLVDLVDEVVPQGPRREISVGTFLVVGAINRAVNPTSKEGVGRWMDKTVLPRLVKEAGRAFDSQSFWDAMDLVKDKHIPKIEEELWQRVLEQHDVLTDVLLYDTTNFVTHIDTFTPCTLAQRGKAKSGADDKRLIGLALACTQGLGIPFLHKVYEGNCHDARLFSGVMIEIVERYQRLRTEAKEVTLVFDKGNNSEFNLGWSNEWGAFCVGSLRPSSYPELLTVPLKKFTEEAGGRLLYRTEAEVLGRRRVVVVVFNPQTFARQRAVFQRKIDRLSRELQREFTKDICAQETNRALAAKYQGTLDKKGWGTYLKAVVRGTTPLKRRLELMPRKREIHKKEQTLGKLILFADREDWTSEQIMWAYNDKYLVEENFRFLKDRHYLRFDPVYHWTDHKIRVHALMCVLGLLLVKLLQLRLAEAGEPLSVKLLLDELNDITEVVLVYEGPRVVKRLAKQSSVQARLWQELGLSTYFDTS